MVSEIIFYVTIIAPSLFLLFGIILCKFVFTSS